MSSLRLWTILLALTCFAAGLCAGMLFAPASDAQRGGEPFEAYRAAFLARFRLSPERERLFGELLANYQQAIEDTRTRLLQNSRPEFEREVAEIGARYQAYIRDHVVPPAQREEFLSLASEWRTIQ
jgi:hypothetical protein